MAENRMNFSKYLIPLFLLILPVSGARAETSLQLVARIWSEVLLIPAEADPVLRQDFIRAQLRDHYDFNSFYETALSEHWESWSAAQKRDFAARFEAMFLNNLSSKSIRHSSKNIVISLGPARINGNRAVQEFKARQRDADLDFKLFCTRDGNGWKVYDVEIDGALLSRNYKAQFNRILRRENYEGLLARFDRKLSQSTK